jgi:phosphatidate cytidylyltransferase
LKQIDRYRFFLGVVGIFVFVSAWYACILLRNNDLWLFISILIVVWSADIGAYFVGRKWGKTKLAALISPGKSWEGVFGGLGCVLIVFCIVKAFGWLDHFETHLQIKLFFSAIFLTGMSVVGDLFESLLKRLAGQKDSSQLLPGHGGVLDRLDALLPTLPIAAVLLQLLR